MAVLCVENVLVNKDFADKKEAFDAIGNKALESGVIENKEDFVNGLFEREKEMSTGFERGIAIPHTLNETVKEASVFVVKNNQDITWDEEGKKINFIICLAIPKDGGTTHIRLLSSIARKLVDEEFTDKLLSCNEANDIYECLHDATEN